MFSGWYRTKKGRIIYASQRLNESENSKQSYPDKNQIDSNTVIFYEELKRDIIFKRSKNWFEHQGFEYLGNDISKLPLYLTNSVKESTRGKSAKEPSSEKPQRIPSNDIALYLSLFYGRQDVIASRWSSQSSGKSGYSPICINRFSYEAGCQLMNRPRGNCSDCTARKYQPVSEDLIQTHLEGDQTLGIYPMLPDNTTRFLAIDFDEANWKKEIIHVLQSASGLGIAAYIEKSRSGNGAHLWVFFDEPIKAEKARNLGESILTKAQMESFEISFSSFDRMFPNQKTLAKTKEKLGNLIALPLQAQSLKQGNSAFVDINLRPYEDQWTFLRSVKKNSIKQVNQALARAGKEGLLSGISGSSKADEEFLQVFKDPKPVVFDFGETIELLVDRSIQIDKRFISPKGVFALRRFAIFKNPEFTERYTYGFPLVKGGNQSLKERLIPRFLDLSRQDDNYLYLPAGLLDQVKDYLGRIGVQVNVTDKRQAANHIPITFNGTLRPQQKEALLAVSTRNYGMIKAHPGFGKTVLAVAMMAQKSVSTLIIVHTKELLDQWIERIEHFSNARRNSSSIAIGRIQGAQSKQAGMIDVAMIQTLRNIEDLETFLKPYGMILFDEAHHFVSQKDIRVLKSANPRYLYGLSATPYRGDGLTPLLPIFFGQTLFQSQGDTGFERILVPRFTNFFTYENSEIGQINEMSQDSSRISLIVDDCLAALNAGRKILISSGRRELVEKLAKKIKEKATAPVFTLLGGESSQDRRSRRENLETVRKKNIPFVLVASSSIVTEGFDLPELDTLMIASPYSGRKVIEQLTGRIHRDTDGKDNVLVYDYVDFRISNLAQKWQKRLKTYSELGYSTPFDREPERDFEKSIFSQTDIWSVLKRDLADSKRSIWIYSSEINQSILSNVIDVLEKKKNLVEFFSQEEINTNSPKAKGYAENLTGQGYRFSWLPESIKGSFIIIDGKRIYFSISPIFSRLSEDHPILRFEDSNTAAFLLESLKPEHDLALF